MRDLDCPRWLRSFLWGLLGLGALCCFWTSLQPLGWGLLLQSAYLAVSYVCIYIAEVENDLMMEAKNAAGDWHPLICALSIYRLEYPEQAAATERLQALNRRFWQAYLQTRRSLLRSRLNLDESLTQRLEASQRLARNWKARLEEKLAQGQTEPEAELEAQISALLRLREF